MTAQPVNIHQLVLLRDVLASLILWMTQSANSPISYAEAESLLARLHEMELEGRP